MAKVLGILSLLVLVAGTASGGFWFYERYLNDEGHVARMQHVLAARDRFAVSASVRFTDAAKAIQGDLIDVGVEGVVDFTGDMPRFTGKVTPALLSTAWKGPLAKRFSDRVFLSSLRTFVAETTFFEVPQGGLVEIMHGRAARLYSAELNSDAVVAFETMWSLGGNDQKVLERKPLWEASRVFLWIDQADNTLHRLMIQFADLAVLDVEFEEAGAGAEETVLAAPAVLPDADEADVPVKTPAPGALGGLDEASAREFPGGKDTDGDGLSDEQEAFYGSNPGNPDTDGDGYSDGEEVREGYSPTGAGALFNFGLPTL